MRRAKAASSKACGASSRAPASDARAIHALLDLEFSVLSIALIGSSGRMGRAIETVADTDHFRSRIRIAARVNSRTSAGELEQSIRAGQVVLEFASPASLERTGGLCAALGKPLLVGV